MGKGLFLAFFLFACVTSVFGQKPDPAQPVPDDGQKIDRMFDLTNHLRAERRIPILGLDARLCHAAAVHAEEMARYNYVSDRGAGIFPLRSNPGSRAWASGYAWSTIAETVCAGSSDVVSVLKSWLQSRARADFARSGVSGRRHRYRPGSYPNLLGLYARYQAPE